MNEETIRFGRSLHLVGTITRPDARASAPPPQVVALLTNAGVISRIGPRRINVKIAQHLATSGIPSFRWDLSGLGDSGRSTQADGVGDQFVRDTEDAMQAVSTLLRIDSFLMIGFCSGAQVAFQTALRDDRLRGLVLFDHLKFRTHRSTIRWWLKRCRALGPSGLMAWLARTAVKGIRSLRGAGKEDDLSLDVPDEWDPSRNEYASLVLTLIKRDVRLLFVYSGSFPRIFNYAGQFHDLFSEFGITRHAQSVFLPNTDHLITPPAEQARLIDLIGAWVVARASEPALTGKLAG
jgi:pimeloyl-ACP methyl ester carboxylesterase